MPRKSVAALSVVRPAVDGRGSYVSPPPELGATERQLFQEIVHTMPPEHFRSCDVPLLTRFVEATAMCERAGREMEESGGPVAEGAINPWFSIQQRSAKMVSVIATRLRMTPHARRDPKTVGRARHYPTIYDQLAAEADDDNQSA